MSDTRHLSSTNNLSSPPTSEAHAPTLPMAPYQGTEPPATRLSFELIAEILTRLPVRSLVRLRCVSKSFKTLISDPQFVKSHRERSSVHLKKLFVLSKKPQLSFSVSPLGSVFNDTVRDSVDPGCVYQEPEGCKYPYEYVIGSCDGLVCMSNARDSIGVWNPSLRAFCKLPDLGPDKILNRGYVFGFGYDRVLDDYKVVTMLYSENKSQGGGLGDNGRMFDIVLRVCTLKDQRWRRIKLIAEFMYQLLPNPHPHCCMGKYINGFVCWYLFSLRGFKIVSFDLAKEIYDEVPQPDYGEGDTGFRTMGVLDGSLFVMCSAKKGHSLWVMKEFGVRESWTKLISLLDEQIPKSMRSASVIPVSMSDDGKILLLCDDNRYFVVYDPKCHSYRQPNIQNVRRCDTTVVYVESLVSPNIRA